MAHRWKYRPHTIEFFQKPESRTCETCGKTQELVVEQQWMRVVSRRWLPLAGRCKPRKKSP